MWIDEAVKNTHNNYYFLFEEFLDANTYNNIVILGKNKVGDTDVYVVKANQYVKNIERTFYFGDFSVMTDLMDNQSYVRKNADIMNDMSWGIILHSKLSKENAREYKRQFKQYHRNKMKEDSEHLKTF